MCMLCSQIPVLTLTLPCLFSALQSSWKLHVIEFVILLMEFHKTFQIRNSFRFPKTPLWCLDSSTVTSISLLIPTIINWTICKNHLLRSLLLQWKVSQYYYDSISPMKANFYLKIAAQGLLFAGFTTLRSAGDADSFYPSFAVAKSIKSKQYLGPTIVGAGHYISVTGGGGDINFMSPDNCGCCPPDGIVANGKDEMTKAVRNEVKNGSDWIKLLVLFTLLHSRYHFARIISYRSSRRCCMHILVVV